MIDVVPYGAAGAWRLRDDIAEIAARYHLKFKTLANSDGRAGDIIGLARDALAWKLTVQRGFSIEQAARHLRLNAKTVREARDRHTHRINEHNARFKPIHDTPEAGANDGN